MSVTRGTDGDPTVVRVDGVSHRLIPAAAVLVLCLITACATSGIRRSSDSRDWQRAAAALSADSSLLNNEKVLFNAAMLFSLPNRGSYNPVRARELFERLLNHFPRTSRRQVALDQLATLYELERVRNAGLTSMQSLQSRIAVLESDKLTLRRSIDSVASRLRAEQDQSAVLRKVASRLESDLQDSESQLIALHNELNHLKAIDLHQPIRAQNGDTVPRKPPSSDLTANKKSVGTMPTR